MKPKPRFIGAWCQARFTMTNTIGEEFVRGEWLWCSARGHFVAPDGRTIRVQESASCFTPSTFHERLEPPPGVDVSASWRERFWEMRPSDRKIRLLQLEFEAINSEVAVGRFETVKDLNDRYQSALRRMETYTPDDLKETEETNAKSS